MTDVIARPGPGHGRGEGGGPVGGDGDTGPAGTLARPAQMGIAHEPALDGLRGLAVAAVVVFHLDRIRGGFLGVDLFFVLSGFLITSLLVAEHGRRRAIDLGRFWVRRARRLLPALFLTLIGVSVLLVRLVPGPYRARFRDDALATLFYVANWQRMTSKLGYWDMFSAPSPFDHMWSLAIEEQFYVVWPLVAFLVMSLARRRGSPRAERWLGIVAVAGAAVSLALLWITYSPIDTNRAYFSTDTRIGPTLLGAALAVLAARRVRRDARPTLAVELLALAALGWMTWSMFCVDGVSSWYYRGGLATFALATLVVIHVVTGGPPGPLGRALSWRPLRLLGLISYGVYLWHWPVIVFFDADRVGLDGLALDAVRVALTLVVSISSFVLVERPIRRGSLSTRQLRRLAAGGVALTLVVVLAAMWGETAPSQAQTFRRVPVNGSDNPYLLYPEPGEFPPNATRLLLVGDSGVQHLGPKLRDRAAREGISVATSVSITCNVVDPESTSRTSDGKIRHDEPCQEQRRELWTNLVDVYDPDVVVYYLANAGQLGEVRLDGEWVNDCDPDYDEYLRGGLHEDLDLLEAGGAQVYMATSPQPGVLAQRSFDRVKCRNENYRRVADEDPGVELLDLAGFVRQTIDRPDSDFSFFRDSLHFSDPGARAAAEWLLPEIGVVDPSHAIDPVAAADAADAVGGGGGGGGETDPSPGSG